MRTPLTWDRVLPVDGAHRAEATARTKAADIVGKRQPMRQLPKHCGCAGCQMKIGHVRRVELVEAAAVVAR